MEKGTFLPGPWYHHPRTVKILVICLVVSVPVLLYLGMTGWYLWQIKQGKVVVIPQLRANSVQFSVSKSKTSLEAEDRSKIESGLNQWLIRSSDPKVTIVAFMDFKCPFSKAESSVLKSLVTKYSSTRKVSIIFKNFPSDTLYPGSRELSKLAFCAFKQGRFLAAYDYLFANQNSFSTPISNEDMQSFATATDIDLNFLNTCFSDPATIKKVGDDFGVGAAAGVRGTPTYFVNGEKVEGVVPIESWQPFIDAEIK